MVSVYRTHTRTRVTDETKERCHAVRTYKTGTHIRHVTLMSAQVPNMGGDREVWYITVIYARARRRRKIRARARVFYSSTVPTNYQK